MKSDILIVANQNNIDRNKLEEIAEAVRICGGNIEQIDTNSGVIEATVNPQDIPVIERMEGVSYIRPIFTYYPVEAEP